MKITVYAHPKSKVEKIEQTDKFEYHLYFNVVPESGKANRKIIEMLSEYFNIPKSNVIFRAGDRTSVKMIELVGMSDPKESE
jgi:uncharacterized protein